MTKFKKLFAVVLLLSAALAFGQTALIRNAPPGLVGTGTPTLNCAVGQQYFDTGADAGNNLFLCTAANTWTLLEQTGGSVIYYTPFVVATGQVPSTQTDFAVLLAPTDTRFKDLGHSGHVASASGFDLRPYSDSGLTTPLTFELVSYAPTTGAFTMWVKVPSLADGYTIYLKYGDTGISTDGSSSSTWASKYRGVYHMGTASVISILDSTSNANNGTVNNGVAAAAGPFGGAGDYTRAQGDYITIPDNATLDLGTGQIAVSAWFKPKSTGTFGGLVAKLDAADVAGWSLYRNNAGSFAFLIIGASTADFVICGNAFTSTSTWYYVVAFRNGTSLKIYVNAADDTLSPGTDNHRNVDNAQVMAFAPLRSGSLASDLIDAYMTEMRVASTAPTANQITTEYNNQSAPSTFAPTGTEVMP